MRSNRVEPICAQVAQAGERQTEDLNVPGSSPGLGMYLPVTGRAKRSTNYFDWASLIVSAVNLLLPRTPAKRRGGYGVMGLEGWPGLQLPFSKSIYL